MRFDERWITDTQLSATAGLAASTSELIGEVIEIGVWQGLSAIPIARAVAPATLHAVDHWLGDEGDVIGIPPELVARDNYGIFRDNLADGAIRNVQIWRMGWREFVQVWWQPVRFLHLDASHGADEVSENLAALLPYAVPGAIFCGDDYGRGGVTEGVHRVFTTVHSAEALWWTVIGG